MLIDYLLKENEPPKEAKTESYSNYDFDGNPREDKVNKQDILTYCNTRNEKEVIVDL